ncbi:UTP--glucose-1-phosphate uridylyltransferase [Nannocystis exedens]|uniref:UTP--glucose-1-phosphate uridylyltransferase n=1 Tax=Nannocystis exedens TaxID=54 RepID=A0A1I2HA14_9BACT|nr:UTP--glucose-1-phosphate uridylyltransferase [Nannocystis exedens]PCC75833.1 UTP-glucose-1-phosphate uridylyltransferase [Nannocystis exedens]SFF25441.1 UTP--glucose-1-phosphate uridylyltransferase [Nannocystis exedens]
MLRPSVADIAFDAALFDSLRSALARGELSPTRARLAAPPRPLGDDVLLDLGRPDARAGWRARGQAALDARKVAALILNGGMATRFGGVVKGVVPVLPDRPDLSFLAVKLAGVRAAGAPAVVMHSFATAAASGDHLATIGWSGVPAGDRHEFLQSLMPRVLPDGTPLQSLPGADVLPDTTVYAAPGHGDTLRRVRESGVVAELRARGVEHLLVSNVDNLGASLDPTVLGAHLEAVDGGAELSVEVVARAPDDAGGCVADVDGRATIIESFRLPPGTSLAQYPHFNTNTLWISLAALERAYPLTWFPVQRSVEWPGRDDLAVIQFEQLIGQITEFARTACLRVDRARFLPIKTRDDLAAARPAMTAIVRGVGLDPG